MQNKFPSIGELAAMAEWCKARRGSITEIARRVVRRDGRVGVCHSAVSRTLHGLERNRGVISAFKKLKRAVS